VIFRRFFRYTDYGIILMECGWRRSLRVFYGSVFGVENLLPVLCSRPGKISPTSSRSTSCSGWGHQPGVILSFLNALPLKSPRLPGAGLLAALIYWVLAGWGCLTDALPGPGMGFLGGLRGVRVHPAHGSFYLLQRLWRAAPAGPF